MGTLFKNQNTDDNKKMPAEDIENFCIKKAKLSISNGDSNLAKSWFLAASNLFPDSHAIKVIDILRLKDEHLLTKFSLFSIV